MEHSGRKSKWLLLKGDLPSERVCRSKAELKDLADNAAFRFLLYDNRRRAWIRLLHGSFAAAAFGLLVFVIRAGWIPYLNFVVELAPVFVMFIDDFFFAAHRWAFKLGFDSQLPVRSGALKELAQTPCSGRDLVAALWGLRLRPHRRKLRLAVAAALAIVSFGFLVGIGVGPGRHPGLCMALLAAGAAYCVACSRPAPAALAGVSLDLSVLEQAFFVAAQRRNLMHRIEKAAREPRALPQPVQAQASKGFMAILLVLLLTLVLFLLSVFGLVSLRPALASAAALALLLGSVCGKLFVITAVGGAADRFERLSDRATALLDAMIHGDPARSGP